MNNREEILKLKQENRALCDRRKLVLHYSETSQWYIENRPGQIHRTYQEQALHYKKEYTLLTSLIELNGRIILKLRGNKWQC